MKSPKILLLGRHGKAPQRPEGGSIDELLPESITEIYESVGKPLHKRVSEYGITPERTFLTHTQYIRTKATGQAVLVGAFDMQPRTGENPPRCQEDLENYDFSSFDMSEDPRLCYKRPWVNLNLVENGNYDRCIDFWLANPQAEEHEGVPITPYEVVSSNSRAAVKENVERLLSDKKDFGVIAAHATNLDSAVLALIETTRAIPVKEIGEIGGGFKMAEFAQLVVEQSPGGVYTARLRLRDQDYKVDLDRL